MYFLNFKPEVADVYTKIADAYKQETGVTLKVVTAASGTYEQTLRSEIVKADPPVLFQINEPIGYENWKDYCAELSGTQLYQHLTVKSLAVTSNGGVYGIPYVVEGYGIIYNGAIMDKYFAIPGAVVTSMDAINNFDTLKAVVEDMTAKKDQLGIQGVFSSTSLKPGEDWRWQTHLANIPHLLRDQGYNPNIANPNDFKTIKFQYSDNFKNIFDLYINNSTCGAHPAGQQERGRFHGGIRTGPVSDGAEWQLGLESDIRRTGQRGPARRNQIPAYLHRYAR